MMSKEPEKLAKERLHTLQKQIVDHISDRIVEGQYPVGEKLPSLRKLADAFQVSHETVKNALNQLKKRGIIEILPGRGSFVKRNAIPKDGVLQRTLGAIIDVGKQGLSARDTLLYDQFITLFNDALLLRSYNLLTHYLCFEKDSERNALFQLMEKVDGLFVIRLNNENLRDYLLETKKKVVTLLPALHPHGFDQIGIHAYETYHNCLFQLMSKGFRHPLFFEGSLSYSDASQRVNALQTVCCEFGVKEAEERILITEEHGVDIYREKVGEWLKKKLPLDIVVAVNDLFALGALKALKDHGFRVPEDVALIGARNTSLCDATSPSLTSIDYHYDRLVGMAMERMFAYLDNPEEQQWPVKMLIEGDIVYRESCR